MAILILMLDTETGHIDYEYPEDEIREDGTGRVPPVLVNGNFTSYLKGAGEDAEKVITGWNFDVRVGQLPEEKARQEHIARLLKCREQQQQALEVVDEDDGTSALDAISHSRLEGAIEICTILLQEMGYEPQPKPTPAPEPQPGKEDGF